MKWNEKEKGNKTYWADVANVTSSQVAVSEGILGGLGFTKVTHEHMPSLDQHLKVGKCGLSEPNHFNAISASYTHKIHLQTTSRIKSGAKVFERGRPFS